MSIKHAQSIQYKSNFFTLLSLLEFILSQVETEHEAEVRNAQDQSSRLQTELTRLRQELQEKTSQEDTLRQQMNDKEEKAKKALVLARQKINQLVGKSILICPPLHLFFSYSSLDALYLFWLANKT